MKRMLLACLAFVAIAAGAATQSYAQNAPGIVDGKHWLASSMETRKAFLLGAGNMIALEAAYSKKRGTQAPPVGMMAVKAVDGMTLDQLADRITRWYERNPTRQATPVMAVVWLDIVSPRTAAR